MGSWGPGTLDNDTALDFLGNLVRSLSTLITSDLDAAQSDGRTERTVLVAVALLSAICSQFDDCSIALSQQTVEEWETRYLDWFDNYAKNLFFETSSADNHRLNAVAEFKRLREALHDQDLSS